MAAGSIIISLLMSTGSFESDTARAGKALKGLEDDAASVGKALGAAFAAVTLALAAMAKSAIDSLDALNDASDATGSTVENLSALESVARRNGATLEDVTSILVKFNKSLKDADGKNSVSRALQAIGLDVQKLKDADPALAIQKVAIALQGFADDGQKARLVQELFGKSIKDAAPFLKDLAESGELVTKATKEQTAAAEEFNRALNGLRTDMGEFVRNIVGDLLPALSDLIKKFKEAKEFSAGGALFDDILGTSVDAKLRDQADRIRTEMARVGTAIQSMQEQLNREGGQNPRLINSIEKSRLRLAALAKQATATTQQLKDFVELSTPKDKTPGDIAAGLISGGTTRARPSLPDVGGKGAKKAAAERQSEAERYLESLEKQLERTQELSVFELALADIQKDRLKGITGDLRAYILAVAGEIDLQKRLKEEERERAEIAESLFRSSQRLGAAAQSEADALEKSNESYREQTEALGLSGEALHAVERARISSAIALKEEALATEQMKGVCTELTDALERQIAALREQQGLLTLRQHREEFLEFQKKLKEEADAMRAALSNSFEDAFASFLDGSKSAKEAFQSFANSVIVNMARIAAQKLAMQVFGDEKGQGGVDWGSVLSSVAGWFGGVKATGGPVDSSKAYMVGERGPEMFVPSSNGSIVPNSKLGGKTTVNHINVAMPANASRETGQQFGAAIAARLAVADRRNN